jgi:hypothetical protein
MTRTLRSRALGFLAVSSVPLLAAVTPHVAFVYPAGAQPGSTVSVTVGGQYLKDYTGLSLSGIPVDAAQTDYLRIYDRQEAGKIKRGKENLEARMAEEPNEDARQLMQQKIDRLIPELAMVKETFRADKLNPAMTAKKQFNPQIAERITLEFTLPPELEPGEQELRILTANGISNPLVFSVGKLPEVSETSPNDTPKNAEPLPDLPVLINGQILPGDVDCFRFSASKGQSLVFKTEARSLIPYLADTVPGWFQAVLALYDASGVEVAYDDDFRFDPDPVLLFTVPEDGDYTLAIRDSIFRGREDFVYRISIGELPFIEQIFPLGGTTDSEVEVRLSGVNLPVNTLKIQTGHNAPDILPLRVEKDGVFSNRRMFAISPLSDTPECEPNNRVDQAQCVTNNTVINGTIGTPGEEDWFCFKGRHKEEITLEVAARRLGSPLDARLMLFDDQQKRLAVNDDVSDPSCGLLTHQADSRITFTLPASGTYFVRLNDLQGKGGDDYAYRLQIGSEQPDYQLRLIPSSLRIPQDGTAIATVHAIRTGGFTGEIDLSAKRAPSGIELQRAVIPEGADSAPIVLSAAPEAREQIFPLELEGAARCGIRTVRRPAVPAEDMMQAFIYRHWVRAQQFLVQIIEPAAVTVSLDRPEGGVIRVHPGNEITLNAEMVWRDAPQWKGVKLTLAEPPEWLTLQSNLLKSGPRNDRLRKTSNMKSSSRPVSGGEVVLVVSPNAEPGSTATVLLNGSIALNVSPDDPGYDPLLPFKNTVEKNFTIDAISIEIMN